MEREEWRKEKGGGEDSINNTSRAQQVLCVWASMGGAVLQIGITLSHALAYAEQLPAQELLEVLRIGVRIGNIQSRKGSLRFVPLTIFVFALSDFWF